MVGIAVGVASGILLSVILIWSQHEWVERRNRKRDEKSSLQYWRDGVDRRLVDLGDKVYQVHKYLRVRTVGAGTLEKIE